MKIAKIRRCSVRVTEEQLPIIDAMYSYGIIEYTDLRPVLMGFLNRHFPDAAGDSSVIAVCQHNGHGKQWGIVMLRGPDAEDWEIVGSFGRAFQFGSTGRRPEHARLVRFGIVPESYPGPIGKPPADQYELSYFYRLATWHDKVSKMKPFDLFVHGAPAV